MTSANRLIKALAIVIICASTASLSAPALSAPADIELLKSYIGDWKGRGTTTNGGNTETVVCKLDITNSDQSKVKYNGRCTLAGGNLSIAGTLAFVEDKNRFEAVMSSNTTFSGVAIGQRRGSGIDFRLKDRNEETGADITINAGMALKSGNIEVDFSVTDTASGNRIIAKVPFSK